MNQKIKTGPVFQATRIAIDDPKTRIIVHQGGTRSGKTYNIVLFLILFALARKIEISIVSETLPHLKRGAMKDFLEIMANNNFYDEKSHNKTDNVYRFGNSSTIEFFSADNSQKVTGASRDLLFINECNQVKKSVWQQLLWRTRWKVAIDYNPADEWHWIYEDILTRDDHKFYRSTFLDNLEFLPEAQVREILRLKEQDPNMWRIYGEGLIGIKQERIFPNFQIINEWPDRFQEVIYGLDFGYNHPTVLTENGIQGDKLYIRDLIYESGLTNSQLIEKLKALNLSRNKYIFADSSEPARIKEIFQAGFNIHEAKKGQGSIKKSIDDMLRYSLHIYKESPNVIKEYRAYSWKVDKNGQKLDEPVEFMDDAIAATRYAVHSYPRSTGQAHAVKRVVELQGGQQLW
jgi:phage terminase large subunit